MAGLPPHPHVLPLLGVYLEDGLVCSVTPFMPGGSLERCLRNGNVAWLKLDDPAQLASLMAGLFEGLAHLHAHGVLHCACAFFNFIKSLLSDHYIVLMCLCFSPVAPRNIIFDSQLRPVICDFGSSRLTTDGMLSTSGRSIAIRWMAPEVVTKSQYYFASDVWSLGVVVWQMLTRSEIPYPEVPDLEHVAIEMKKRNLDLRTSLPTHPQWDALRCLVRYYVYIYI